MDPSHYDVDFRGCICQPPCQDRSNNFECDRGLVVAIFPGASIFIVVFAWDVLGDALRDVLDPRLRGTGSATSKTMWRTTFSYCRRHEGPAAAGQPAECRQNGGAAGLGCPRPQRW